MHTVAAISIMGSLAAILAGCSTGTQRPVAGVIKFSGPGVGSIAPDIPFTSLEGKSTSLRKVSEPIAILAFVDSSGDNCCRLVPKLVSLAANFRSEPVTVAQISMPDESCPHGPGCSETCHINDLHLVSLCDADKIAWAAYGQPEPGTLILVDDRGRIVALENIGQLESVTDRAERLATGYKAAQESMYQGG